MAELDSSVMYGSLNVTRKIKAKSIEILDYPLQKAKLTGDDGSAMSYSGDLNNLIAVGNYQLSTGTTNSPVGFTSGIVEVIQTTFDAVQRATDTASLRVFQRFGRVGSWSTWVEIENAGRKNVANGYAGLDSNGKLPATSNGMIVSGTVTTRGQTWSRILFAGGASTIGHSFILNYSGTRGSTVFNHTLLINMSHSGTQYGSIVQLNSNVYSILTYRIVGDGSGNGYLEVYDSATDIPVGLVTTATVTVTKLRDSAIALYPDFVNGTTVTSPWVVTDTLTTSAGADIVSNRFISDAPQGTSPIVVNSTTEVAKLNPQYHGGKTLAEVTQGTLMYAKSTSGGTNIFNVTLNPAPPALANGLQVCVKAHASGTGVSVNTNGLGAKAVQTNLGIPVDFTVNGTYLMVYDADRGIYILQTSDSNGSQSAMPNRSPVRDSTKKMDEVAATRMNMVNIPFSVTDMYTLATSYTTVNSACHILYLHLTAPYATTVSITVLYNDGKSQSTPVLLNKVINGGSYPLPPIYMYNAYDTNISIYYRSSTTNSANPLRMSATIQEV